jgi:hypothetical protein
LRGLAGLRDFRALAGVVALTEPRLVRAKARALCCAMVKEGTPGKYQLRAVVPGSRRPLLESHATRDEARRRAKLERAEYTVMVTVDETVPEGWEHPTGADKAGW